MINLSIALIIIFIAFISEYVDSSLGMGYGTILTPVLLLLFGFTPLQIVPSILLSELFSGLLAGILHNKVGNVNFSPKEINLKNIFKIKLPKHLKIALIIALCSIIGTVSSVFIALSLSKFYLKLYIGILIFSMGLYIIIARKKEYIFSWKKIIGLGILASFNKGISGGGYGPIITSGQLLSGIEGKNAIGITSLAEGLTCLVGIIMYFLLKPSIDLTIAPFLIIGALLSIPFSVYTVKQISTKNMKIIIGIVTLLLGLFTLLKVLL